MRNPAQPSRMPDSTTAPCLGIPADTNTYFTVLNITYITVDKNTQARVFPAQANYSYDVL